MATSQDTTFVSQTTAITASWAQSLNDSLWKARNPLFVTSTGSGSSYVIKLPTGSLYSSIVAGDSFSWKAHAANTGVTTLTIIGAASLGPKPLTKNGSTALSANDIAAGAVVECVYDGTNFQVTSITGTSTGGGGGDMPLFTQVGTGAVARTYQSKEEDLISVKDFGAVGDDITDDTDPPRFLQNHHRYRRVISADQFQHRNLLHFPHRHRIDQQCDNSGTDQF